MLQVIVGPNVFAARQKLYEIRDRFVSQHGDFALEQFDCQETSYDKVRESLQSMPFLAAQKMVLLDAPNALKEFKDNFEAILSEVPESTEVLIYEPAPDKRTSYFKFLKSQKKFYSFENPDEHSLAAWVVNEAKQNKGTLSLRDANYLVNRIGGSQYALKNELDKLLNYDTKITKESINLLTEASPKATIFELLEAAFSGRAKQAMEIYAQQRQLKVEPQQIIAMLAWQLHVLALLATAQGKSDGEIAKAAKISPFVVGKSRPLLASVGASRLKQLITDLAELDYKAKTSAIEIDRGLQTYIAAIS